MKYFSHLVLIFATVALSACSGEAPPQGKMPLAAVSVVVVEAIPVGGYREFVARTEAFDTVELRARVEGYLEKRTFREGQNVEKDQILFEIDKEPLEAIFAQAKAELSSRTAAAKQAKQSLERGMQRSPQGFISQQDLDTLISSDSQASSAVAAAQSSLKSASINLKYATIRAPFKGRIGKAYYSEGNLVGPTSEPLAELMSTDTMQVNFQVEEELITTYLQHKSKPGYPAINLKLQLPNRTVYEHEGNFNFADTKVDKATGTVTHRVDFPNPDGILLPGMFVTLVLESNKKQNLPLIPQASVQENLQGSFVLLLDAENAVASRHVELGRRIGPMWVAEKGLVPGDRIIVEGLQKVRPGVNVNPVVVNVDRVTGVVSPSSGKQPAITEE